MKNSDFKSFLISLSMVVAIIFIMDLTIGNGLKQLYHKQRSGYLYRSSYAIDSTSAEYLVIGSSRANHHYDSKIFEEKLNKPFYNCGRDGQNIIYSCAVVSAITNRYKPKLIIIDILPNEFTIKDEDRLSSLLPYHENPIIKPYLKYYSPFENIKLISHIYPYNSLLTSLVAGVSEKNIQRSEDYHGYTRLVGSLQNANMPEFLESGKLDSIKYKVFDSSLCQLNKDQIPVLIIFSPMYYKYATTLSANLCENLCRKYENARFLNFASDPGFKNARYFNDNNHLNEEGATLFSNQIVESIEDLESKYKPVNKLQ